MTTATKPKISNDDFEVNYITHTCTTCGKAFVDTDDLLSTDDPPTHKNCESCIASGQPPTKFHGKNVYKRAYKNCKLKSKYEFLFAKLQTLNINFDMFMLDAESLSPYPSSHDIKLAMTAAKYIEREIARGKKITRSTTKSCTKMAIEKLSYKISA